MQITILQRPGRITNNEFKAALEHELARLKGGLSVTMHLTGFSKKGFGQLDVQGVDSEILVLLIERHLGIASTIKSDIEIPGTYQGIIDRVNSNFVEVDVGIEKPAPTNFRISARTLRAQLADGKSLRVHELCEDYCLFPETKVLIRLSRSPIDEQPEAWLGDSQINTLGEWARVRLDRIRVLGLTRDPLNIALRKTQLERDIISVEQETLATHTLVCKLGTDAVGLIPKLGRIIRRAELKPFLPQRIMRKCREW